MVPGETALEEASGSAGEVEGVDDALGMGGGVGDALGDGDGVGDVLGEDVAAQVMTVTQPSPPAKL